MKKKLYKTFLLKSQTAGKKRKKHKKAVIAIS